ncbi:ribonuclease HI family protein [Candidatus Babeliales bacterium]|nr:ribonuclease HI family protein [Candidatus Babeliales bacterium]
MEKQLSILMAAPRQVKASVKPKSIKIFIDGASRSNPGPAGAGVYIECNGEEVLSQSAYLGKKTNNQAEYLALILGIYLFKIEYEEPPYEIIIVSDSELLVKQMLGQYKIKDKTLRKLQMLASNLLEGIFCKFNHVLRINNKKADKLANIAIDEKVEAPKEFISIINQEDIRL